MKHLKRLTIFVLSLIAVIVCALGLVACGDDKDTGDDGTSGADGEGDGASGDEGDGTE